MRKHWKTEKNHVISLSVPSSLRRLHTTDGECCRNVPAKGDDKYRQPKKEWGRVNVSLGTQYSQPVANSEHSLCDWPRHATSLHMYNTSSRAVSKSTKASARCFGKFYILLHWRLVIVFTKFELQLSNLLFRSSLLFLCLIFCRSMWCCWLLRCRPILHRLDIVLVSFDPCRGSFCCCLCVSFSIIIHLSRFFLPLRSMRCCVSYRFMLSFQLRLIQTWGTRWSRLSILFSVFLWLCKFCIFF